MNSNRRPTRKVKKTLPDPTLQAFIKNYSDLLNEQIQKQNTGYIFGVAELCGYHYEYIPDHKDLEIYFKKAVDKRKFPKIRYQGRCSTRNCNLYKKIE